MNPKQAYGWGGGEGRRGQTRPKHLIAGKKIVPLPSPSLGKRYLGNRKTDPYDDFHQRVDFYKGLHQQIF